MLCRGLLPLLRLSGNAGCSHWTMRGPAFTGGRGALLRSSHPSSPFCIWVTPISFARRLGHPASSPSRAPATGASTGTSPSSSPPSPVPRKRHSKMFTAPPHVGPGRKDAEEVANPYKSWEHLSHSWLILMCLGCLCAGWLAGHFVEVDESKIKPHYVKEEVIAAACSQFDFRPDLAATSVRVAFVLAARRAGFPAETVDESCAVVRGLNDIAGVINFLATTYGASTEDAASLAAIAGLRYLNGPYEAVLHDWRWGRNDTDVAPPRKVPKNRDQKMFSLFTILSSLGGLTEAECVALLACHSVGEFHDDVSGVEGATHTGKRYTLSNRYFQFLLEHEKELKPFVVPRTQDNKEVAVLPQTFRSVTVTEKVNGKSRKRRCIMNAAEVELLQNKAWRDIVVRYAADEETWRLQFQCAFTKMIDGNFKRLRTYSDPHST